MISKTSFLKILKNDVKRKLWIFIVFLIIFIFINPISLLMQTDNLLANSYLSDIEIRARILSQIGFSYFGNSGLQIILAVFMGYINYSYLFSRKKVDLYHSLSINRTKLFFINYIIGFSFFITITLVTDILNIAVLCIKGFMSPTFLLTMGSTLIFSFSCFFLFYNLTVLATLLTGRFLVSISAFGTLVSYIYICHQLWSAYFSNCMRSYYMNGLYENSCSIMAAILSPIYYIVYLCGAEENKWIPVLCILAISIIILILNILLYKIRPSEAAGKALCFKKMEAILTILITVPAALCGGIYIKYISERLSIIWFWFAFLSSAVICHCLLKIIFYSDFKAAFKHKLHLLVSLSIGILIALSLQYDWFGYDTFIPDKDKIEYASVCFYDVDSEMSYYDIKTDNGYLEIQQTGRFSYLLNNMKLSNIKDVLSLAEVAINQYDKQNKFMERYQDMNDMEDVPANHFVIKYHMKSGKDIYRDYSADLKSTLPYLSRIYNSKEYKSYAYQIQALMDTQAISNLEGYSAFDDKVLSIKGKQIDDLLNAYCKDLDNLTIDTLCNETPIMSLRCNNVNSPYNYADLYGYYVYPSFINTLNILKEFDVSLDTLNAKVDIDRIESIQITKYSKVDEYPVQICYEASNPDDLQKIKELAPKLELSAFVYSNCTLRPYEDYYDFGIKYIFDNGMDITNYAVIRKGEMPDFVIHDIENMGNSINY